MATYINRATGERYVEGGSTLPRTNEGTLYEGVPTEEQLVLWGYVRLTVNQNLSGKYFVKKSQSDSWQDITTMFNGIKVLSIDGFNSVGKSVNIYTEQWVNSQTEDFLITTQDQQGNDVVIRENVDLQMTFIISRRYSTSVVHEQTVFNNVKYYFCDGDFYIKSLYPNMEAHVVCLKEFSPTAIKLHRGERSYIMGTITLHCLSAPTPTT